MLVFVDAGRYVPVTSAGGVFSGRALSTANDTSAGGVRRTGVVYEDEARVWDALKKASRQKPSHLSLFVIFDSGSAGGTRERRQPMRSTG